MKAPEPLHIVPSSSSRARSALDLTSALQDVLAKHMETVSIAAGAGKVHFHPLWWGRDGGQHGGGCRLQQQDTTAFDRISINVSGVHYDDLPTKRLASASALSAIVHPYPGRAPSMHVHISFTEMRDGTGYWRLMTDLNPSHPIASDTAVYRSAIQRAFEPMSGGYELFEAAVAQGDRYFYIPALGRHRGAFHCYLEQYTSGEYTADYAFAERFGRAVISAYADCLSRRLHMSVTTEEKQRQLDYHTLYFFQVLTLDRGTTSGLLVHDQNDVGILGSLPSHVDVDLLGTWRSCVSEVQRPLLEALISVLPAEGRVEVTEEIKRGLASEVREFYRHHPDALALQARGDVIPPTVENHR